MLNLPVSRTISGAAVSSQGTARVRVVAIILGVALALLVAWPATGEDAHSFALRLEASGVRVLGVQGASRAIAYLTVTPEPIPAPAPVLGVDVGGARVVAIGLPAGQTDSSLPSVIPPGMAADAEPGPIVRDGRVIVVSHVEKPVAPGVTVVLENERPLPKGVTASTWDPITRTWTTTMAKE